MHPFAPGHQSSLPLASSSVAILHSIRSDCQKQDHTGATPNSSLNSEGWGLGLMAATWIQGLSQLTAVSEGKTGWDRSNE